MKLRTRHLPLVLLTALLLALGAWTAWVAASTETGWCVLRGQWYNATLGWLAGEYQPIGQRDPDQQADFWVAETERILAEYPDDPQLAMGAAWLLDSPGFDFMSRYVKYEEFAGSFIPKPDYEAIARAEERFEQKTSARCLELAARATQLEPNNVEWWRQRALLLSHKGSFSMENPVVRDPAWLDILAECSRHDPDTALYDYLAATRLWDNAAECDIDNLERTGNETLLVHDAELLKQGNEHFRRGLRMPSLSASNGAYAATLAFLKHSRSPRIDWPRIIGARHQLNREQRLLRKLLRWPGWQAFTRLASGSDAGVLELLRQPLRVLDQLAAAGDAWPLDPIRAGAGQWALLRLRETAQKHPGLVSDEELARIEARHEAEFLDMELYAAACNRWRMAPRDALITVAAPWTFSLLAAAVLSTVGLVLCVVAAWMMGRHLTWRPRLGWIRSLVCCVVAFALTFVVLGLAPAGIITPTIQRWILGSVSAAVFVALIAWGIHVWYTRRRLQFTIRTMLWVTLGVAALCALVATLSLDDPLWFVRLASGVEMPARGFSGQGAEVMGELLEADKKPWEWAIWQWIAYGGMFATLGVWLLLVVAWHLLMRRRGTEEQVAAYRVAPRRARFGALLDCVARSALGLAACLLVIHLALTPRLLKVAEADYQFNMAYLRDPLLGEREVRAVMAEMRADAQGMALLRADVKAQIAAELGESEGDEPSPE